MTRLLVAAAATALAAREATGPTRKPSKPAALALTQARPVPGHLGVNRERLRRAIKAQESGGCRDPYAAVGDRGRSRGAYQFGVARWKEVSKARYPGTPAEQDAAMRSAIARYLRSFHGSVEQQVRHAAYRHNGAGPAARRYAEQVWRRYNKGET